MKTILQIASLVAALAASASLAHANPSSADARIAQELAVTGRLAVANVGDYVHAGSYRIWVSSRLGEPSHVLPDGTWLYNNRVVEHTAVGGTLAIFFKNGRVSSMSLLSPAAVTVLLQSAKPASALVATR